MTRGSQESFQLKEYERISSIIETDSEINTCFSSLIRRVKVVLIFGWVIIQVPNVSIAMEGTLIQKSVDLSALCQIQIEAKEDVVPCIRNNLESNRDYFFKPGVELHIRSTSSELGYPSTDPGGITLIGLKNVSVNLQGVKIFVEKSIALSQAVVISECEHISWTGGAIFGSRFGLNDRQENVGIGIYNSSNVTITGTEFFGFSGNGSAFAGDWNRQLKINKVASYQSGIGVDLAFIQGLVITNSTFSGEQVSGAEHGHTGISIIFDWPFVSQRRGQVMPFRTTDVKIQKNIITGFDTGISITDGSKIIIKENRFIDLPGRKGVAGIGVYLHRNYDVSNPSRVGGPTGVEVNQNSFENIGGLSNGIGVLADAFTESSKESINIHNNRYRNVEHQESDL